MNVHLVHIKNIIKKCMVIDNSLKYMPSLEVIFRKEHFRHLIGFDKLRDIAEANNKKNNIYENI